jgi:hypothetical protein
MPAGIGAPVLVVRRFLVEQGLDGEGALPS